MSFGHFSDSSMLWRQLESLNLMNQELLCWQLVELVGMIYVWSWQNWHILLSLCLIVEYWMFLWLWHWLTPMTNEEQVKQIVERRITHSIVTTDSDLLMTSMIYWEFSKYAKTLCLMPERINFFEIFELSEKMIQKKIHWFSKITKCKILFLSMFKVD